VLVLGTFLFVEVLSLQEKSIYNIVDPAVEESRMVSKGGYSDGLAVIGNVKAIWYAY
jgi:hypothetical protein